MSNNYSQGKFQVKNPEKYVGKGVPTFRSSWEHVFMSFCDNNPNILKWASESIKIPYRNPLTGKQTIYVHYDAIGTWTLKLCDLDLNRTIADDDHHDDDVI